MKIFIEFTISLFFTITLGIGVKSFLNKCLPPPKRPKDSFSDDEWNRLNENYGVGGYWVGFFERILFLIAFWFGQYFIIGAWLAFKVAAKWETWKNIIKFPIDLHLDKISPLVWYNYRKLWGSMLLSKFLVGTLMNILIGAISFYFGSKTYEFICYIKCHFN